MVIFLCSHILSAETIGVVLGLEVRNSNKYRPVTNIYGVIILSVSPSTTCPSGHSLMTLTISIQSISSRLNGATVGPWCGFHAVLPLNGTKIIRIMIPDILFRPEL